MNRPPLKIFIVDDVQLIREYLVRRLAEFPMLKVVGQAAEASKALSAIPLLQPDVVILDLRFPGGGGLWVLKKIKEAGWPCKVLMLTSIASLHYRERCLAAGADHFFDKAEEFEQALEALKHYEQLNFRAAY